jgi:hypothetical protein
MFEIFINFTLVGKFFIWLITMEKAPKIYIGNLSWLYVIFQFGKIRLDPVFLNRRRSIKSIEGHVLIEKWGIVDFREESIVEESTHDLSFSECMEIQGSFSSNYFNNIRKDQQSRFLINLTDIFARHE